MRHPSQFIVLEGGDGSGKTTQAKLLSEALAKSGPVSAFKFPRKDAFFGSLVYECLSGEHGDFLALSPYIASLPYAIDQARARPQLEEALECGHVICDRYAPSNMAHQAAKVPAEEWANIVKFIETATYDELGALRPDLIIYLDVPVEISMKLLAEKGIKKDQHEDDLPYQRAVREVYRELARERLDWRYVDCMHEGKLRSPEENHNMILDLVYAACTIPEDMR